jgi:hypothetical protein
MTDSLLRKLRGEVGKARRALAGFLALGDSPEDEPITDDDQALHAEIIAEFRRHSGRAVIDYIQVDRLRTDRRELDN